MKGDAEKQQTRKWKQKKSIWTVSATQSLCRFGTGRKRELSELPLRVLLGSFGHLSVNRSRCKEGVEKEKVCLIRGWRREMPLFILGSGSFHGAKMDVLRFAVTLLFLIWLLIVCLWLSAAGVISLGLVFFFIILVCKLKYTLFQIFSCCSTSFKSWSCFFIFDFRVGYGSLNLGSRKSLCTLVSPLRKNNNKDKKIWCSFHHVRCLPSSLSVDKKWLFCT